jgi:hypothetical protein
MRINKSFEQFSKDQYLKSKKKKEEEIIQIVGDEYIEDIVREGDFEGLKYLLDTGYILEECEEFDLLAIALNNNQKEMINYLLKNGFDINNVSLSSIVGRRSSDSKVKVDKNKLETLKTMIEKGYLLHDGEYNYIDLYFCGYIKDEYVLIKEFVPFIDWLLKKYPENYKYVKDYLPKNLKDKYINLEDAEKYNL